MSEGYRVVDIRGGASTRGEHSELDQISASDALKPAAVVEPAIDDLETPPLRATDPAGTDTENTMIPNGWFG